MLHPAGLLSLLLGLALAPLLLGVINRTKAVFAGRRGPPLVQLYYDLWKLLHKGVVYSHTATWVFRAGPVVGLAAVAAALALTPLGGAPSLAAFPGDLILVAYLLGLARFATVLAALDTGSSFEGMGASREVLFSALAEPALLVGLGAMGAFSRQWSLSGMYGSIHASAVLGPSGVALLLVAAALWIVLLAENARIPVDDPNTHLELTMIHEVMVLDHSGAELAMIEYASALKYWIFAALVVGILAPVRSGNVALDAAASVAGVLLVAAVTGVIESTIARLKLVRVPQFLVAASMLSLLALALVMR